MAYGKLTVACSNGTHAFEGESLSTDSIRLDNGMTVTRKGSRVKPATKRTRRKSSRGFTLGAERTETPAEALARAEQKLLAA